MFFFFSFFSNLEYKFWGIRKSLCFYFGFLDNLHFEMMTNLQKNHKGNTETFFYFVRNWRVDRGAIPSPPQVLISIFYG